MKGFFSLTVGVLCLCTALQAEVPSLINYQGRLTDSGGTPVNGAIDVVLRVYDAKTEGKMVYEETISQVSVVNGVYSFGYGSAGKTVKRAAELVAVADGETKVFNYATEYKPLLGDVQLSDGSYTWGTLSGPSDATQFIGSVNAELGNVTGIYIQNAPDADKIVNVVYHYHEEGIVGALSQNKECWQELTINGKTLSPRERLVSVPFAITSLYANIVKEKKIIHLPFLSYSDKQTVYPPFQSPIVSAGNSWTQKGARTAKLPHISPSSKTKIYYKLSNYQISEYGELVIYRKNLSNGEREKISEIYPRKSVDKDQTIESQISLNTKNWDYSKFYYEITFSGAAKAIRDAQSPTLHYLYLEVN